MDFKDAFTTILAGAGSAAAIGFVAKLFANSLASAAMKKYDLVNAQALESLKLVHQKELEDIRSQLNKLQKEHEIVFGSLYIKREEVVHHLYKLMSEVTLLATHKQKDPQIDIADKCQTLLDYFDLNRLCFPKDVANDINTVMNTVFELNNDPNKTEYKQLVFQLKIQVYSQMEAQFRELLKTEDYR